MMLRCLNCGSPRVERSILQSESDDADWFWCLGCDLPVDAANYRWWRLAAVKLSYWWRKAHLAAFMSGGRWDAGDF